MLSNKYESETELPEKVSTFMKEKEDIQLTSFSLTLGYEQMDAYEVLKDILPEGVDSK